MTTTLSPATGSRLRPLTAWACLAVAVALLLYQADPTALVKGLGLGDFIAYWAAGRLNGQGENPYSWDALLDLQQPLGWPEDYPNMMYYPPWTLALVMPFGALPFATARLIWLFLNLAAVVLSADLLWRYYGGAARYRLGAWLLALSFVPTLITLRMGQIGPLLLLGIVGFLCLERLGWGWLAGAMLLLPAVKPQLVYLFGLAVLVWAIDRRRWTVLAGCVLATLAAVAIALAFRPAVLADYRFAVANPPSVNVTPTVGALLRLAFGEERTWLQYPPTAVGVLWFLFYWRKHRGTWDWGEQAPLLLLMSFLTTAYGAWVFDLVVLLVPLFHATVWGLRDADRRVRNAALGLYLAMNAAALAMNLAGVTYPSFIWMTPAIFLGYLALMRNRGRVPAPLPA